MTPTAENQAADAASGEASACPPPLAWQDVFREFSAAADHWTLDRPGCTLRGMSIGRGPPLVFLNSLANRCEILTLLAWLLRDEFRCLLFDWRGVRSPDSTPALPLDLLVDDVLAILDQWSIERNHLVGFGFGGLASLGCLAARPERFDRVVLCNAYARKRLSSAERLLAGAARLLSWKQTPASWIRRVLVQSELRWFPPFDESRFECLVEAASLVPPRSLGRLAKFVHQCDLSATLNQIAHPALVVVTEGAGTAARTAAQHLRESLADVHREELNNTGQFPALTHPHRVAKVIRSFLNPAGQPQIAQTQPPQTQTAVSRSTPAITQ